jgi:hypothetical protein
MTDICALIADDAFAASFQSLGQYRTALLAALAQPEPQGPMPEVDDILRLAAIIRRVDGNHDKGAAALAEAILSHPDSRWQHAQPEPQGPTDAELITMWATTRYIDQPEGGLAYGRAVLARWGRPTIEPVAVSERLPGPEDCDAERRCWWFFPSAEWDLRKVEHIAPATGVTHWLPHWALPVPKREAEQ